MIQLKIQFLHQSKITPVDNILTINGESMELEYLSTQTAHYYH